MLDLLFSERPRAAARLPGHASGPESSRILVETLVGIACRGLSEAFLPGTLEFPQTMRATRDAGGTLVRPEGRSDRYTAIAALGLARLPLPAQREILRGHRASDVVEALIGRVSQTADLGALSLAAWAAGEVLGECPDGLLARVAQALGGKLPMYTVDVAWALTASVACAPYGDTDEVSRAATTALLASQGREGLWSHSMFGRREPRWRAHVGSFADQVYPMQALARVALDRNDAVAGAAALRAADQLVAQQGPGGQWWWHYDSRTGRVVERFPVYSVHQHAMAPMTFADVDEALGSDHRDAVTAGLGWLDLHPEVIEELVSPRHGVVWRKVGRREPRKAARGLAALGSAVHPRLRPPGLDRMMPARVVDYECRPYELGWLLYAWAGSEQGLGGSDDGADD
jgi:hypothetical protein